MQAALEDWENVAPALGELFEALERNDAEGALPFDADLLAAPLPRAFGWIDGTSYPAHMERARSLRGVGLPDDFSNEPLMGERVSVFLGGRDPIPLMAGDVGMDIEGEVGVILDDVPIGRSEEHTSELQSLMRI